ncbi:MAG: hypothetical protein AAGL68_03150 [Pseudomonadota bacterium]
MAFVILGGVALYLARTIEHGEARFDSETGKVLGDDQSEPPKPPVAARRMDNKDENERNENA